MLGLLEDYRLRVPTGFPRPGLAVYLLGETLAELGGSEFAEAVLGVVAGQPPALDLEREAALLRFLRTAARARRWSRARHDCGDGGIAIALAESAIEGGARVRRDGAGRPAGARRALQRVGLHGRS